jgi:hypothetical protein
VNKSVGGFFERIVQRVVPCPYAAGTFVQDAVAGLGTAVAEHTGSLLGHPLGRVNDFGFQTNFFIDMVTVSQTDHLPASDCRHKNTSILNVESIIVQTGEYLEVSLVMLKTENLHLIM